MAANCADVCRHCQTARRNPDIAAVPCANPDRQRRTSGRAFAHRPWTSDRLLGSAGPHSGVAVQHLRAIAAVGRLRAAESAGTPPGSIPRLPWRRYPLRNYADHRSLSRWVNGCVPTMLTIINGGDDDNRALRSLNRRSQASLKVVSPPRLRSAWVAGEICRITRRRLVGIATKPGSAPRG